MRYFLPYPLAYSKKGDADTSTLTLVYFAVGITIGLIFLYAGTHIGRESLIKSELYAKDLSLLTNAVLSLPQDTDVILQYPHDFRGYTFSLENANVVVYYSDPKKPIRTQEPYLPNPDYELNLIPQQDPIQYTKIGKKITDHAPRQER